ncbi:hypothetical protein TWF506_004401 [Arthrobotrys conoides]|uniref:Enterotoxin n=1 Tax=Arthrobotrys conoides TaxID=74498 RepID=A0AAN8NA94_9PEZI
MRRLTYLLPLLLLPTPTTSYYTMTLRQNRPSWFKSWNYIMDARPLKPYLPNTYYATNTKYGDGFIESFTVRNNLNEPTIPGVALYHSDDCGKRVGQIAYHYYAVPFAVILFDAFDPYGINTVNLLSLGIKWYAGSWRSIDLDREFGKGGLLDGMANTGENGVVIWEGNPEWRRSPYRRVWIPNVVDKIPEGRDFLETLPEPPDRKRYVYLRDLVERFITPGSEGLVDVVTPYFDALLKQPENTGEGEEEIVADKRMIPKKLKGGGGKGTVLRGPLHDPSAPKSSFSYDTHYKENYTPIFDDVALQFPTVREDTFPGMVYYESPIIDELGTEIKDPDAVPIVNTAQIEPDKDVVLKDALETEVFEPEPEGEMEDNGVNAEFQRFLFNGGVEEPNDSEISGLLNTESRENSRPMGELWAGTRPVAELGENVQETIALEKEIPVDDLPGNPSRGMQVEEELLPIVEIQEGEIDEEQPIDRIQEEAESMDAIQEEVERLNQMEEERLEPLINPMSNVDININENSLESSPSVSNRRRLRNPPSESQRLEILNRPSQLYEEEEQEREEQRFDRNSMMAPINMNRVEDAPVRNMMDMSARLQTFQNPFRYDRNPFASTSSHRRGFQIPPLERVGMDDLGETSFSSTGRRQPRPGGGDSRIIEEDPGPHNSPSN